MQTTISTSNDTLFCLCRNEASTLHSFMVCHTCKIVLFQSNEEVSDLIRLAERTLNVLLQELGIATEKLQNNPVRTNGVSEFQICMNVRSYLDELQYLLSNTSSNFRKQDNVQRTAYLLLNAIDVCCSHYSIPL